MAKNDTKILDYLRRPNCKPRKAKALAKKLGITKKKLPAFEKAIEALIASGKVVVNKNGLLRVRDPGQLVAGTIKRIAGGAGFFIPHVRSELKTEGDLYISVQDMGDAHTGDEVLVRPLDRKGRAGRHCGRIAEVIERATNTFVGSYLEEEGLGLVQVDGTVFDEPVFVGDPGAKGARKGDKVVIEMLRFPSRATTGEGVLTEVLGPRGKAGVDVQSIIHEFGLPGEFPEAVLADARAEAEQFDEEDLGGRTDLTRETIVTIDPKDARDFDDAISLTKNEAGNWLLGVHIADVSHFVQPGSALDREAQRRGTSVYLPGRVIPMLPEVISNGLASLQKGRLRYAKSAFVEFTPEGTPLHVEFANSAIKVTRRFAYEQVMPVVEGREGHVRVSAKVKSLLRDMHKLAMTLRKKRFRSGALELYLPEVKIDFSKTGRVSGAHETEHDESHQMIEEFMLAANIAVATNLADREVPCLRRTHADPDHRKLEAFARFAGALGYKLKQFQSRSHLQKLLNEVRGEPTEQAINFALLRSMKQAEYAAVDVGHFALAVAHYCHFTSPIRRYPDLMIHRLIDGIVAGKRRPRGPGQAELQKMGTLCSNTERRAAGAERELVKVKLLTYMSERIDDEFEAVITGVERFGVFSRGVELPAEGFTHISWLSESDHFYHDADSMSLIGRRSGTTYRLGDRVRVRVAHVDVDRRELDYHFVNEGATSGTRRRKASSKEAPARGTKRQGVSKAKRGQSGRKPAGKKKTTQHKGGSGKGLAKGTKGPAKKKGKGRKRRR